MLPAAGLVHVPAHLSYAEASPLPCAALTAWNGIYEVGRLRPGSTALFLGTGGVSIFGLQFAHLGGMRTIVTSSSNEKLERARELGADETINYREREDWDQVVLELTGGRGVDIVYDPIGDKVADESLRCLAWGGRLLILGFLGGGPTSIRSNYLLIKGIDAIGVRIGGLMESNPALAIANMKTLVDLAGQGKLKPRISHRFRLDQTAEALQAVIDSAVIGKAVIVS